MADDNMEIASDLGQDHGMPDDYLDLDIDLTTGHLEDEDFILDDADQGDHQALQPSPITGGDDIMLDEEENPDQMHDEDLLDEEQDQIEYHEHEMEDEAPSHSFVTVNDPYNDYTRNTEAVAATGDDLHELGDSAWEQDDTLPVGAPSDDEQLYDTESFNNVVAEDSNAHQNETEKTHHVNTTSNRNSQSASSQQDSQEHLAVEEPGSPSISNHDHQTASRHGSPQPSIPGQNHNDELDEGTANTPHFDDTSAPETYGISVVYRETEYALFGSSDSNDPDSFFLSDLSIADKPISEFFKEIRNVIHEDISEEEELCVTIKHFGISIEEIACSFHDVTLSQILVLHEKLSLNDEVAPQYPLRIHLHTRISFAKRLANLLAGAAAGKGLSELVVWDERSEQHNKSGEGTEHFEDYGASHEDEFAQENVHPEAEIHADLPDQDDDHYSYDPTGDQDLQEQEDIEYGGYPQEDQGNDEGFLHTDPNLDSKAEINTSNMDERSKEHQEASGVDEDGDLIDYSDDELEAPKVPTEKGKNKTAKYEAINEELRRRSLSRSAELRARTTTPEISQEVYAEETLTTVVVETGNDALDADDWNAVEGEDYEYNDGDIADGHDGLNSNDDLDLSVGAEQVEERAIDDGNITTGFEDVAGAETEDAFDEDDADHNSGVFHEGPPEVLENDDSQNLTDTWNDRSPENHVAQVPNAQHGHEVSSSATASLNDGRDDEGLTYEDLDEVDLAISAGNKEVAVETVVEDEIDYDDDDYAGDLSTPPSKPDNLVAVSNGSSSKRTWQDLDDDSTNYDAKRVRA